MSLFNTAHEPFFLVFSETKWEFKEVQGKRKKCFDLPSWLSSLAVAANPKLANMHNNVVEQIRRSFGSSKKSAPILVKFFV